MIKSPVRVGFTRQLRVKVGNKGIIFSPECPREGQALHDSLRHSSIVVCDSSECGKRFGQLLAEGAKDGGAPVLSAGSTEAEAITLFANYLPGHAGRLPQ